MSAAKRPRGRPLGSRSGARIPQAVRDDLLVQAVTEIGRLMNRRGLSQSEVAERAGVSRQYVSQIMTGQINVTFSTMARLASALDGRWRLWLTDKEDV